MEIQFYQTSRKKYPILKFIKTLPKSHQKKIASKIDRLERYGLQNSICIGIVKKIQGQKYKGLYELLVNYDKCFYRITFYIKNGKYCLIHAFKKKSNKTPIKELKKSISRIN